MASRSWKIATFVASGLLILATLFGGIGQRFLFGPRLVYQVNKAETVVGPNLKDAIRQLARQRKDALEGEVKAEHPDWGFDEVYEETTRRAMLPENLIEDHYLRLDVTNSGRASAEDVRVTVRLPGVAVHHSVQCSGRPGLKAKPIAANDYAVPTCLEITEEDVPRLVAAEQLTLEIWYHETRLVPGEDLPYDSEVHVQHSRGMARALQPSHPTIPGFWEAWWSFMKYPLLFLAGIFAGGWFSDATRGSGPEEESEQNRNGGGNRSRTGE